MDQHNSSPPGPGSTFLKCLSCSKLVRLPANPDPNAIVRCPRCEQTYPIGVLLDSEIPELEIVESPAAPGVNVESDDKEMDVLTDDKNRFIVAPALANGAKRKKRRRSSGSGVSNDATPKIAPSRGEPRRRSSSSERSSSSRRRKSSGGFESNQGGFELTKIILGAMLAPPVAQLVIWWGLQLDPLNIGPTVSKVVPAVVPAQFHPKVDEDDKSENGGGDSDRLGEGLDPDAGDRGTKINDELPRPPSNIENGAKNDN